MNCPNCNTRLTCMDSRMWDDVTRQRRYKCSACKGVHYTQETFGGILCKARVLPTADGHKPDMRGRHVRKFDTDTVLHLRELYKNGYSTKYLSSLYKCHQGTMQEAIFGRGAYK